MYYFVERSVAVVKPKQALFDWIKSIFSDLPENLNLEVLRIDCNSYMIPEVEEIEDGINFIDEKFEDIFALELASWTDDKSLWPTEITLVNFWEWFDVDIFPTTIDLSEKMIDDIELTDGTFH